MARTGRVNLRRRFAGWVAKKTLDVQRLARAVSGPGVDTRLWVSSGTVGVVNPDGTFEVPRIPIDEVDEDVVDQILERQRDAYFVDDLGALVSVRLEPSGAIVTARWNGVSCGAYGNVLFPLRPGDEVVVAIPDGQLPSAGICVIAVQSNRVTPLRTSEWDNDTFLMDLAVPFVVRAPQVDIQSANLSVNGRRVYGGLGAL